METTFSTWTFEAALKLSGGGIGANKLERPQESASNEEAPWPAEASAVL